MKTDSGEAPPSQQPLTTASRTTPEPSHPQPAENHWQVREANPLPEIGAGKILNLKNRAQKQ